MMRSFFKKCGAYALGAACLAGAAQAQDYRSPSLLPSSPAYPSAAYAPRMAATARSVVAPATPEGPLFAPPQPELSLPANVPLRDAPGLANGGYGYNGNQAPGVVYEGGIAATPDVHGGCAQGACGDSGLAGCMNRLACSQTCWFGGVRGLAMDLLDQDAHWFSYDDINLENQILNDKHADMDWSGGVEARIGRWFDCCRTGVELVYWGIYPGQSEANRTAADVQGTLNHVFTFNSLSYDAGLGGGVQALDDFFNDAQRHRVIRDWQFHNVEVNVLNRRNAFVAGKCCNCGPAVGLGGLATPCGQCMPRFNVNWLAGFRYFRFDEGLQFASDDFDTVFNGDPREIYYDVDVKNELYGLQLGGDGEFYVTRRFSLSGGTKFGVYANHMRQRQQIYGAGGDAFVNDPISPNFGQTYNISSRDDDIAFLGEIEAGANFYLTNNLRLTGGYRVVAATGVARTSDQIPYNFDDLVGAREINTRGTMVLHGAYGGLEFNY